MKDRELKSQDLYSILVDMGFQYVETPITSWQRFVNRFYKEPKHFTKVHNDWVFKNIDGKHYEVFEADIWYTFVRIDGIVVFDERRYELEDLLSLISNPINKLVTTE